MSLTFWSEQIIFLKFLAHCNLTPPSIFHWLRLCEHGSMEDDLPFHFSNLSFHFEHFPYSMPKLSFHSIPFFIPFHSMPWCRGPSLQLSTWSAQFRKNVAAMSSHWSWFAASISRGVKSSEKQELSKSIVTVNQM